jgi:hypothetical protein
MKTFKMVGDHRDILVIEVPDDVEASAADLFALGATQVQREIASGRLPVTARIWPCFYCGKNLDGQAELVLHLETHTALEKQILEKVRATVTVGEMLQEGLSDSTPPRRGGEWWWRMSNEERQTHLDKMRAGRLNKGKRSPISNG